MSLNARWTLDIASLLFAAMFVLTVVDNLGNPVFWLVIILSF